MPQTKIGIRALRSHLSANLRRVKAGETVVITERGKPIARIVRISQPLARRLDDLTAAGLIAWSGNRLQPVTPVARTADGYSVADIIIEMREQ